MSPELKSLLEKWASEYNNPVYFTGDPVSFPREFVSRGSSLRDVEIAAVFAAHFAWGRRAMIVRDCERFFDFLEWKPEDYVMSGDWRDDDASIHRTVKWSDTAAICARLKDFYRGNASMEVLDARQMRTMIFGQKDDPKAANKKINMMRRWMVRRDGIVDLGLWKNTDQASLVIPLDVHVHRQATELGILSRTQKDLASAVAITDAFREIWPEDPVKGDFALFGYGVNNA